MYVVIITIIIFLLLSFLIISSIFVICWELCIMYFVSSYFTDALSVLFTYPFTPLFIAA
jgi:tetrahydromethanopterin S-methyltransferase subunit C